MLPLPFIVLRYFALVTPLPLTLLLPPARQRRRYATSFDVAIHTA